MRLDKFLKVSRIIKRRTLAREFAENGRVLVNDKIAKPATIVKLGDIITIQVGERKTIYEILDIKENIRAAEAKNLYRQIE
ncbi:MAG TPA: RNA-binding S4 domain-containing protein [Syntrophomonadaceae bacterium]|nr:RNA-binding S4 domain-containing protein [Syntrophomonadaceae bacterium]